MAHQKQTDSKSKDESHVSDFNFPCGDLEEMFKMMQNFCGGEGSFDCGTMMRKMFGDKPKETDKQ